MKNLKLFSLLLMTLALAISCNKNSPVDQYVDLIEQATAKIEKIQSIDDLQDVESTLEGKQAAELEEQYSDYQLTESDKSKLKTAMAKFIDVTYSKSLELSGLPVEFKDAQVNAVVKQINQQIDKADTLGEIGKL